MATALSVSRLTVREALSGLEARGLLAAQKGRRHVVRTPNGEPAGDFFRTAVRRNPASLYELLEVRRALEVHIAQLAAVRSTRSARSGMEAALATMEELSAAAATPEVENAFHEADVQFHEALAAATSNTLLIHLIEQLAEPLRISRRSSWQGRVRDQRPLQPVVEAHRKILDRVVAGDPTGAANAMRTHLDATEHDLRAALDAI